MGNMTIKELGLSQERRAELTQKGVDLCINQPEGTVFYPFDCWKAFPNRLAMKKKKELTRRVMDRARDGDVMIPQENVPRVARVEGGAKRFKVYIRSDQVYRLKKKTGDGKPVPSFSEDSFAKYDKVIKEVEFVVSFGIKVKAQTPIDALTAAKEKITKMADMKFESIVISPRLL